MTIMADREATTKNGMVIVISGPSGVGKSTICHRLCDILPAEFSVSVTTRPPRRNEAPNRDYRYVDRDTFDLMRDNGEFLEHAEVYGHSYGTPLNCVQAAMSEGRTIILEIDVNGCCQVRDKLPEALTIFVLPPTPEHQQKRLEGRGTDSRESVSERLSKADGEIRFARDSGCYDAFIENDDLDITIKNIELMVKDKQVAREKNSKTSGTA